MFPQGAGFSRPSSCGPPIGRERANGHAPRGCVQDGGQVAGGIVAARATRLGEAHGCTSQPTASRSHGAAASSGSAATTSRTTASAVDSIARLARGYVGSAVTAVTAVAVKASTPDAARHLSTPGARVRRVFRDERHVERLLDDVADLLDREQRPAREELRA